MIQLWGCTVNKNIWPPANCFYFLFCEAITINWDRENLPGNAGLELIDVVAGKSLDMREASSYTLSNSDGSVLIIKATNL